MKKVTTSSLLTSLIKRSNSTMSTTTLLCGNSKLTLIPSLNIRSSLGGSFSSIVLNNNNKKCFHNNLYTNFFNFENTQQKEPIEAATSMEYSEEETKEIIEELKCVEDLYKKLEQQLRREHDNFIKTGETMSPELFQKMIDIVDYYNDFIDPNSDSTYKQFYTSSIGLKIWNIVTKVKLLIVKSIIQEWFTMNVYLEILPKIEYIPGELEDDRIYFNRLFGAYLMHSAFVPLLPMTSFIPYTRETFIASIYFIIYRLRNGPVMLSEFLNYMKEIVREYPIIKERYLNAKIVTTIGEEDKMVYEQDKEFTFLEKKYSEHEFDWFEDIETNLPLNLSSLIKVIEGYLYFSQDIDRFHKLLEESLKIDSNNFYTLLVASNYSKFVIPKDHQHLTQISLESIENCERGLEILQKAKPLPLREEIKLEEGEVLPERKNDLKLFPFHYEKGYSSIIFAEVPELAVDLTHSYSKKAIEEFLKVELFTRFPLDGKYYLIKGNAFFSLGMFEQAIHCYQYVDKYSSKLPKQSVIDAIVNSCNSLVAMGYAPMCLTEIDKYIEKYEGDIRLRLLKIYVEEVMCKSKADLTDVKEKCINIIKELSDPNFKIADDSRPYFNNSLEYVKRKITHLENSINDPNIAETW
ncbi:hypothetical protein ABK040_003542 [Willaertia magna]